MVWHTEIFNWINHWAKGEPLSERQLYIIGVPIAVAVGLLNIPADLLNTVPEMAQYLLNSPIAVSAIVCIVLNKVLPERTAAEKRSEQGGRMAK